MNKKYLRNTLIFFSILMLATFASLRFFTPDEFQAQKNPALLCETAIFDKSAFVFDSLLICGTKGVAPEKLAHAANVAAEWLDNDEDGKIDEPRLLDAFQQTRPVVLMTANEMAPVAEQKLISAFDGYLTQALYAFETNPAGQQRDASQEEIHHIIMNAGWQTLSPATFSEIKDDNSTLYQAWKVADENELYVYQDPTCGDRCKVTEFVYMATAAYMETGAEKDLAADELRPKSREELAEDLPIMIQIFESNEYAYPVNHWPDGHYSHQSNIQFEGT